MTTVVDAVIAFTLAEALALIAYRRATGRGPAPGDIALNLLSGLCLMLALAGALRDAGAAWLLACLAGAGAAHASDLWLRARRAARQQTALHPMNRRGPSETLATTTAAANRADTEATR